MQVVLHVIEKQSRLIEVDVEAETYSLVHLQQHFVSADRSFGADIRIPS